MIDSVLKGTGNSRFLKSAVPAGTSWADALAMLQAGTFPIDFNGINTEGFQQVGTPLNKANLLKDATAAQIGLPPSTTPDGMFQALGNTGELHVWRKTVVTGTDIPAGYNVTDTTGVISSGVYGYTDLTITYSDAVDVNDTGGVTLREPTTTYTTTATGFVNKTSEEPKFLSGKFFTVNLLNAPIMYQKPTESWNFSFTTSYVSFNSGYVVKGYPLTPAGTTTTYPVSTNPKAYQEGDDAKAAGYVVGEVVSGKFRVSLSYANGDATWEYGTSLTVSDDGTVNIANPLSVSLSGSSSSVASRAQQMAGKYAVCTSVSDPGYEPDFSIGTVVFFPSDTLFTRLDSSCWASKYQPVTGYAAIPAGTTIEYLGKLGDKARVQVVSYVGTGTYGSSNPNSLTFDFVPKAVLITSSNFQSTYVYSATIIPDAGFYSITMATYMGYESRTPGGNGFVTKSNKTIMFYSGDATVQLNTSGLKYTAVAIG